MNTYKGVDIDIAYDEEDLETNSAGNGQPEFGEPPKITQPLEALERIPCAANRDPNPNAMVYDNVFSIRQYHNQYWPRRKEHDVDHKQGI